MDLNFLEFEQPIAELQAKIEELRRVSASSEINLYEDIERLEKKSQELTRHIFSALTPWQIVQVARHPQRPYIEEYIKLIFTDFTELHGDRHFSRGPSIMAGVARLNDTPVMVIGHRKGRNTKEKVMCNFGMPRPEDYRKALRLMKLAEKFHLPIITFVDTPGAYPGIGAEERNQSEAIARNLLEMSQLKTPIVCTVIGEGGSGGALAIAVGDRIFMLEYSVYSVISPEGCASILWKSAERAADAAEAMQVNAKSIKELKLIDKVIAEPLGGAHRNPAAMAKTLKTSLVNALGELRQLSIEQLVEQRYRRFMNMGIKH